MSSIKWALLNVLAISIPPVEVNQIPFHLIHGLPGAIKALFTLPQLYISHQPSKVYLRWIMTSVRASCHAAFLLWLSGRALRQGSAALFSQFPLAAFL